MTTIARARNEPVAATAPDERTPPVPRLVLFAWGALLLNVLSYAGVGLIPIPRTIGQVIAQLALPVALLFALAANRRLAVRPNLFLVLMTILAVVTVMVSIHNQFVVGSTIRSLRLLGFVVVLWALTPWAGHPQVPVLRAHLLALSVVTGSVVLGEIVAHGKSVAFDGRLSGIIWPIPPTQVAHYAAIIIGATVVLWLSRVVSGRLTLLAVVVPGVVLYQTHTRTALAGLAVGLVVAAASMFVGSLRVRRVSLVGVFVGIIASTVFASQLTTWLLRGQTAGEVSQLTGRTKVWDQIAALQRPPIEVLFGTGASNLSFNGLPIDSSWMSLYVDAGWFGIVMVAATMIVLFVMALTRPRGPQRAVALFLIGYCVVASFTETGLGIASPYLLDTFVALTLLLPAGRRRT